MHLSSKPFNKVIHNRLVALMVTLFLSVLNVSAQSLSAVKIKVLKQELQLLEGRHDFKSDSLRVEDMNQIALYQSSSSRDSAIMILDSALPLTASNAMIDLRAVTFYNYGQVYEQHGEFANAESAYQRWYDIRKVQSTRKYRWAMSGMREFYSRHLQLDKLEVIDQEWVNVLENQLETGEDPLYGFEGSMLAVVDNLVRLGEYYKAEAYFLRLLENESSSIDWLSRGMLYFRIERYLIDVGDTEGLKDWYSRWFSAIAKHADINTAGKTLAIISRYLWAEPAVASSVLEHLHTLAVNSGSEVIVRRYLDLWIPILNKTVEFEKREISKNPNVNRYIQHSIIFNVRAATWTSVKESAELRDAFLLNALEASKALHSTDGLQLNSVVEYLQQTSDQQADKKMKKSLKKVIKVLNKL